MAVFREDDLPTFLADFGETAILEGGGEVTVIFDNEYAAASLLGIEVESANATVTGLTSDLEELEHEDTIEIREVVYTIKGIHPDGQGLTTLVLAR